LREQFECTDDAEHRADANGQDEADDAGASAAAGTAVTAYN